MAKRKEEDLNIKPKLSSFVGKKLEDISSDDREIIFIFNNGNIKVSGDNFKICIN